MFENNGIIMAQNYLEADTASASAGISVPVSSPQNPNLRICYDGQMGSWDELTRSNGIPDGPFREERLLLELYQCYGTDMLRYLNDAIFAFVISDGDEFFVARDLLGIKPLFFAWEDQNLYLASELKSIIEVTEDVHEFPPGHYMDRHGRLIPFAQLPEKPPDILHTDPNKMTEDIRSKIRQSLLSRVDFSFSTGSLLSGGIDSSVIAMLASEAYKEKYGKDARLKTFVLGVEESTDIHNARVMADYIDSDHYELVVDLNRSLAVLPEVIYYLESFDPSLVRSSISNFLISKFAKEQGIQVLLSGEGGDEIFCGYTYLKDFALDELFARQMECIGFLHNNASLRLDRMNQCNGLRVVAPIISGDLFNYSLAIPPEYKQRPDGKNKSEKWIFRKAYEQLLPKDIAWRLKQEFSQGSGIASLLPAYFEETVTDDELADAQAEYPVIRSKEEFHYFRIFIEHFGAGRAVDTVGQWICL
jgi:asparagine synthase (glutamine-hydrolysing)